MAEGLIKMNWLKAIIDFFTDDDPDYDPFGNLDEPHHFKGRSKNVQPNNLARKWQS